MEGFAPNDLKLLDDQELLECSDLSGRFMGKRTWAREYLQLSQTN